MLRSLCLSLPLFVLFACSEAGEIVVVPDNTAPPDLGVSEVVKENYLNKLYISLLGRKATDAEFSTGMALLNQNNTGLAERQALIGQILEDPGYAQRTYDRARVEILNNLDTAEVSQRIGIYYELLTNPQYADFQDLILSEIERMEALQNIPFDLLSGQIDRRGMHLRCVNNLFYDEINMGSQNFVLAMFEYFLGRYPTATEEAQAILMVDGFNAVLFGEEGNSKGDYLEIFFASNDYYEGQVLDIYQDFLFRSPTSTEMSEATVNYQQSDDYAALLKDLLSTDEYLGL